MFSLIIRTPTAMSPDSDTPPAIGNGLERRLRTSRRRRAALILALTGATIAAPMSSASAADFGFDMYDVDGDGSQDASVVDIDGDGYRDANLLDVSRNRRGDTWLLDVNQNDVVDAVLFDRDENGAVEQMWVDADEDNVFEAVYGTDPTQVQGGQTITLASPPVSNVDIDWSNVCATDPFWCGVWPHVPVGSGDGYTYVPGPYENGVSVAAGLDNLNNAAVLIAGS